MDSFKKLVTLKREIAQLEASLADRSAELRALPRNYGFEDMESFITTLRTISGSPSPTEVAAQRKRARITSHTKTRVRELWEQEKTGKEIAEILGISRPSVQNIKRELGITRAHHNRKSNA